MLEEAVRSDGLEQSLDAVLSVESVGVFKPDPRVYHLAEERWGRTRAPMAFVSLSPRDAFGILVSGFQAFRIDRNGQPAEYGPRDLATEWADPAALPRAPR